MTIKKNIILFVLLLSVQQLLADDGGSGYSRFGLGDIRYFPSSRFAGMGGAGIASLPNNAIDHINPANLARVSSVRYEVGLLYEGFSTTDGMRSAYLSSANFNSLMVALPVDKANGLVIALGVTPFSKVNYHITAPVSQGGLNYTLGYKGTGGISQAQLGMSFLPLNELSIGVKVDYYFGTIHRWISQSFNSTQYTSGDVDHSTRLRGAGFTFGAVYTGLKNVFHLNEANALNIGMTFSTSSYLSATDEIFYSYNTGSLTTRDTTITPSSNTRIPYAFGAGISYLTERWLFAGDLSYQNWNAYDARGGKPKELRDSYRFGAGAELLPKRDINAPYTQRIAYRAGLYYNASYYQVAGEPLNEFGLTAGFGIPILPETRLNIGFEYSFRGTTDKQLQKDNIFRVSFTLSGSELWFVRTEEE